MRSTRLLPTLLLISPFAAAAVDMDITLEVPRLNVAEYHRPYVAVWIERPDHSVAANLTVWYDIDMRGGEGATWLKDMRQWWRRSGRRLQMPVDGVSGATRPAGQHQLGFKSGQAPLGELAAGEYILMVEVAREVGGREVVSIPFAWPAETASQQQAEGSDELGLVRLSLKP